MIRKLLISVALALNATWLGLPAIAHAATTQPVCDSVRLADPNAPCDKASGEAAVSGTLHSVLQTMVFVIGIISVLVIVIAGLMYVVSAGNPDSTRRAKDAILYAIIGIIVALLAQAIVSFFLTKVG